MPRKSGSPSEIDVSDVYQAQEALELVRTLQSTFSDRDKLYKELDDLIYLKNAPYIPENYRKTTVSVRSPMALHIVNSITSALSKNSPQVHFDPIGLGDGPIANAQDRKGFFENSWVRQEQDAKLRIFRRFMHSVIGKGEGIAKTVERTKTVWAAYGPYLKTLKARIDDPNGEYANWDDDGKDRYLDAATEEYKRGLAYPIVSIDVPPETFYPIKGDQGFSAVAEVKMIPFYGNLVRYKAGMSQDGRIVSAAMGLSGPEYARSGGEATQLKLVELWDWERVLYILQGPGDLGFDPKKSTGGSGAAPTGMIVKQLRHGYGDRNLKCLRGPYFHCYGITTSSRDPALQGLSVLFGYMDLFPLLDSLLTIQSNSAFMTGFATYKRKMPAQSIMAGAAVMDDPDGLDGLQQESRDEPDVLIPGSIYPYDLEPVNQPRSGADLGAMIGLTRSMLELALPTAALGQAGDSSGYALNQAQHLASLAWDPIIQNAQFCWAERTGFESWLIENRIREKVSVWGDSASRSTGKPKPKKDGGWLTVGPSDLNGIHRYTVVMKPETPSNEIIEIRKHEQLIKLRAETPAQMREALGRDPLEVEKGWLLEDIKNEQQVREQFKQRVWQELGTVDKRTLGPITPPAAPPSGPAQQPIQIPQGAMVPGMTGAPNISVQAPAAAPAEAAQAHPGLPPGTPPGAPGGVRNTPHNAEPLPGGG